MVKVDAARSNLQTILDNLTAGVIVLGGGRDRPLFQPRRHPHSCGRPWRRIEGRPLSEVPGLADFAAAVERQFARVFLVTATATG